MLAREHIYTRTLDVDGDFDDSDNDAVGNAGYKSNYFLSVKVE